MRAGTAEVKPDRIAMRYVYMEMLRVRIAGFVSVHNNHRIRKQPTREHYLPTGKPRQLYEYANAPDLHESSLDPDATCLPSCEKATELTELLWPSSVCRQALQSVATTGLVVIQFGSSASKTRRVKLRLGLNISADTYACRGVFSITPLLDKINRCAS